MTRKKITLAYISNDTDRKASYKKRTKGLIKKVRELSTLCEVEACAIIYGRNEKEPELWPSREGAQQVLEKFMRVSKLDRTKMMVNQEGEMMVNQEGFSQQCIEKARIQLQRLQRESRRNELELFMYRVIAGYATFQEFDMSRVAEMSSAIQQIRRDIKARIEALQGNDEQVNRVPNNAK